MNILRFIIPFFAFLSIVAVCSATGKRAKRPGKLGADVAKKTFLEIQSDNKTVQLVGTKISSYDGVKLLGINLNWYGRLDKQEARRILIKVVTAYVDNINSNKQLAKILQPCPFTWRNVEVTIAILAEDGHFTFYPDLSLIALSEGTVEYWTKDHTGYKPKTIEEEPFEKALRLLKEAVDS